MSTDTEHAIPTGTWGADPVHSTVGFAVDYMAGTFNGTFSRFEAVLTDGVLKGSAEVASIQVKDPNLEAHLQSPEFFDAERHPELRLASGRVAIDGEAVSLDGEITIKGVTRPLLAHGALVAPVTDFSGNERVGLRLTTTVDRRDFGVSWNAPLPAGGAALSNDVTIVAELYFVRE